MIFASILKVFNNKDEADKVSFNLNPTVEKMKVYFVDD